MSGLKRFTAEGAIIGRLLTGYTDLELDLFHCVQLATGDFDEAMRAMYGTRGEARRIKEGMRLGRAPYQALGLARDFDAAVTAMRHCLQVRNQYAHHTFWDDYSGQLAIGALEEVAKQPAPISDLSSVAVEHVDAALLQLQERYFDYTDSLLTYVNYEGRYKAGKLAAASHRARPTQLPPPKLHL
jgi:hypothetical protein